MFDILGTLCIFVIWYFAILVEALHIKTFDDIRRRSMTFEDILRRHSKTLDMNALCGEAHVSFSTVPYQLKHGILTYYPTVADTKVRKRL